MSLLRKLEEMVSIKVLHEMMLWSGRDGMQRRIVQILVSMTSHYLKCIKTVLPGLIESNLGRNVIIYASTAQKDESLKEELEQWTDLESPFEGDIILVHGDQELEIKSASIVKFPEERSNPMFAIDNDEFYPRVLVAASSCIGAGLDSASAYSAIRIGFPTSILNMVQEMGRCGRTRSNDRKKH